MKTFHVYCNRLRHYWSTKAFTTCGAVGDFANNGAKSRRLSTALFTAAVNRVSPSSTAPTRRFFPEHKAEVAGFRLLVQDLKTGVRRVDLADAEQVQPQDFQRVGTRHAAELDPPPAMFMPAMLP